jgi:DNA-binding NarL/FixJ family response regulator
MADPHEMARGGDAERPNPLPLPARKWNRIAKSLRLSPRQKQIAELILQNRCDKQIVAALGSRMGTVRTQIQRMFDRTGVADRHELVLLICRMSHDRCR